MTSPERRNAIAADYVAAFQREGVRAFIANLDTAVALRHWGEHALPVTINDGARGETFVCSPLVGYRDYPLEELARFPNQALVPPLRLIVRGMGAMLARAGVDRIVHVNNWMMSTNLPIALDPSLTLAQTEALIAHYPTHVLAIRSLTRRYSAPLIDALAAAGWIMLPSRQVFLLDDVAKESLPRRDSRRDDRLWQRGAYRYDEPTVIDEADAARIAHLYAMLYLEKYSWLNPAFTGNFVKLSHEIGLIKYLVLRDAQGTIQAFGGLVEIGGHATMPLLGYDTSVDQSEGLYRLAFHAGTLHAASHGLRLNMSSGATAFKRHRGATPEMEFTAFHVRHLARARRLPFALLQAIARHVGMPILQRYDL